MRVQEGQAVGDNLDKFDVDESMYVYMYILVLGRPDSRPNGRWPDGRPIGRPVGKAGALPKIGKPRWVIIVLIKVFPIGNSQLGIPNREFPLLGLGLRNL